MAKLRVNSEMLAGEDNIEEGMTSAFQRVLAKVGECRLSTDGLVFNSLYAIESKALEIPYLKRRSLQLYLA